MVNNSGRQIMAEKMVVTPWETRGEIDYDKLIKEFGTEKLAEELVKKIEKKAGKSTHFLRRKIYFSHRGLKKILEDLDNGKDFVLYTGRGPSGETHLGHLLPYLFTKYLQDAFNAKLYYELTDDEKFFTKEKLSLKECTGFAYDNALDFIACGFKSENTRIIIDTKDIGLLYPIAAKVAEKTTFSTAKAVFGFSNETNIGWIFFPAIQASVAFIESELKGKRVNCLIPCGIEQDPYWRIARDVAEKLGYPKPGAIHGKFLPGLKQGGKMSASDPSSAIWVTDSEKEVDKKIGNAFTGGRATVEEQRRLGGNPEACNVHAYYFFLFEQDDEKLARLYDDCRKGKILCGECKKDLAKRVNAFLKEHMKRREEARKHLKEYLLK